MAWWWKRNGTMVNIRWYERETTIVRWWNNDVTMVKKRWYDSETAIAHWWKRYSMMVKMRWYDDETAMPLWWKRNIIFIIVSSHHRDFTIIPSLFHHRAVVFPSSYHCTIVHCGFRETNNVTEHCNRAIFERYNIVTRFASRRNLASSFVSRTSTQKRQYTAKWYSLYIPYKTNPYLILKCYDKTDIKWWKKNF
jgi:hypothetical protein